MLVEKTLFGIRDKEAEAIERLRFFENLALRLHPNGYFVADGGGKDSSCIVHLCKLANVKHECHFHRTTLDPPELIQFLREHRPDTALDRPKKTIVQLVRDKCAPPTAKMRYCCGILKETGGKGRMVVTGVRWEESPRRKGRRVIESCKRPATGKTILNPIVDWTTEDVWEFHRKHNLPYCCLYDEGFTRIGCVGCPMASRKHREMEFARWPGFERLWRLAFRKMLARREQTGWKATVTGKTWRTVDDVFDAWMHNTDDEDDEPGLFD
jgi:phosphoadenosine phosphosulfate reductase